MYVKKNLSYGPCVKMGKHFFTLYMTMGLCAYEVFCHTVSLALLY